MRIPLRSPMLSDQPHDYLRRLPPEYYRGQAYIHWSMTIAGRTTGWLDAETHLRFREIQAHTLHRYHLICPAYCLMPDHMHLFWIGLWEQSDQRTAARFLRDHFGDVLQSQRAAFQKQPYDHVLRPAERERDAVPRLAFYITANPERAGLVADARAWPFSGAQAVGYPDLDGRQADFAERFWKIHALEVQAASARMPLLPGEASSPAV